MHSAVSPRSLPNRAPNSGALTPLLARHINSPSLTSTIAAPVALVARQACSTISLSTISIARSTEASIERPPPLFAANRAASSPRSDSTPGMLPCEMEDLGSGTG